MQINHIAGSIILSSVFVPNAIRLSVFRLNLVAPKLFHARFLKIAAFVPRNRMCKRPFKRSLKTRCNFCNRSFLAPRHSSITTLSKMTLSIATFGIKGLFATLRITTLCIECHWAVWCLSEIGIREQMNGMGWDRMGQETRLMGQDCCRKYH
jgi:hypothetical protein